MWVAFIRRSEYESSQQLGRFGDFLLDYANVWSTFISKEFMIEFKTSPTWKRPQSGWGQTQSGWGRTRSGWGRTRSNSVEVGANSSWGETGGHLWDRWYTNFFKVWGSASVRKSQVLSMIIEGRWTRAIWSNSRIFELRARGHTLRSKLRR